MSYEECEQGLLTQLRSIDGFSEENTSLGDWSVLNYGFNKGIVVEYYGMERQNFTAGGPTSTNWKFGIELCVLYTDDVTVHDIRREARQAIMDRIQQYPQLGIPNIVFNADIVEGRTIGMPEEGSSYFLEELVCLVTELSHLTIQ